MAVITCFHQMGAEISNELSMKWTKQGTMSNGEFSILPTLSHNTGNAYMLSEVLEDESKVEDRYYLDSEKTKQILNQAKRSK